jgi:hypothetical protein
MNTSNIELKHSNKKWGVAEKIIGFILLLWSMYVLYTVISVMAAKFSSGYATSNKTAFTSTVIRDHFIIIVGILCLFGSCLLLYKDKTGWLLCVVTSLMYGINLFISSRSNALDNTLPFAKWYKSYGVVALLFFIIFFLLLSKQIRQKYQPTSRTWLWMAGLILVMVIDKLIF